jgi:N-acetylglucosamine-6-phosphate deacetylase
VSAGFLDMQVNGFSGADYSLDDLQPEHIAAITHSLGRSGTTQHVPTIVTSPADRILKNLDTISRTMEKDEDIGQAVAGVHIEGPFISGEDGPRGAHDSRFVRDPDFGEFLEWQAAAKGRVKIITLAPEREGAIQFIEKLAGRGVLPAIGHTGADPQTIRRAVAAGARLSTHLGNGSHASLPRLRNYIWEQLAEEGLQAGIISDGFHLPPAVVKVFYKVKGPEKTILVSDAALLGGRKPGLYKWGNLDVEVFDDGHLGIPGTAMLAGAGHLLDWDIPRFMEFTGAGIAEAIRLCTVNPAKILKLEAGYGRLEAGSPGNLTVFRVPARGPLAIEKVFRRGRLVYPEKA